MEFKLGDFLPVNVKKMANEAIRPLAGYFGDNLLQMQGRRGGRLPAFGPEMGIAHEWIRSQAYNRLYLIQNLYTIALLNAEVRTACQNIRNEIFRRGLRWVPKFASKCVSPDCGIEYQHEVENCPVCGARVRPPDERQKNEFTKFMRSVNAFGQPFERILRTMEDDTNITDDGFGVIIYAYTEVNGSVKEKPVEIYRLHPALVNFDLTSEGEPLRSHWSCPIHREMINHPGECPVKGCQLEMRPVFMTYFHAGQKVIPLFRKEVPHLSKFSPSPTFGFSPILTIFEKVLTLIGMDKFVYRYFYERKMPSAMLVTATDDPESIRREREYIMSRMQSEPDFLPWVATSARTGRGRTELVRLFHTLQEMDYLPVRNEIRERVSAIYGVTPTWMGAPTSAGGLTAQTTELTVTSRVVEGDQRLFNEDVVPEFLEAFDVTDWSLELMQPEEKAESTRIDFAGKRVTAARQVHEMGFDVKVQGGQSNLDNVEFIVSGEAKKLDTAGGVPGAETGGEEYPGFTSPEEETSGESPPLHEHSGRPPHPESDQHRSTYDTRSRQESAVFQARREEEEEEEREDDGLE